MALRLRQWFSTGNRYVLSVELLNLIKYVFKFNFVSAMESISRVTILASHGATCQPNEYCWQANFTRFALNGVKNFSNAKGHEILKNGMKRLKT